MKIIYPDFAFLKITQLILFFINILTKLAAYYWGANLLEKMIQQDVGRKRKLIFSAIPAVVLDIMVVYGISWINGFFHGTGLTIGVFCNVTKTMFPLFYFPLYLLGVYILRLPPFRSVKLMHLAYIFYACCTVALRVVDKEVILSANDFRGYNYLRDIYMLVAGTVFIYILYRIALVFLKKCVINVNFPNSILVENIPRELLKNFLYCCMLYVFITLTYYHPGLDGIHCILLLGLCIAYLIGGVANLIFKTNRQNLNNKEEHIAALNHSIQEFRGIKHDFNNILQTYSGYFVIQDYERLSRYHEKLVGATVLKGRYLDLSQRIPENPSFFSLLIKKMEHADQMGVIFEFGTICSLDRIYMDELHISRIFSILFDNAIEAAIQSGTKHVDFSTQKKNDGSILFILSNDTAGCVDLEHITLSGYSTKEGHMGQGLAQVRNIINRYGNVTLNFFSHQNHFTVYLEMKPNAG